MKNLPITQETRNAFVVHGKTDPVRWAERVAREMGKRPEDIVFCNTVSLDGLTFRPVLNTEVLNLVYADLMPGDIYRVGPLYLRKDIVVLGVNDHTLVAPPMLVQR